MDAHNEGYDDERAGSSASLRELVFNILFSPIRLSVILLTHGLSVLRPFSPQLIPIIVCILLVPVILLLSAYAGWSVWNTAAVNWQADLNLQYGDGVPPYAYVPISGLVSQQRYDISIDLSIPASDANLGLGNFMITLTLLSSSSNKTITSIRRSTLLLPPRSSWFFSSHLVHLHVPMLKSFVTGTSSLTAFVELGRNDGWKSLGQGQGRELTTFSASIRGEIVRRGIRGLISRFPLLAAFVSGLFFFGVLSLTCGACLLPMIIGHPEGKAIVKRELTSLPPPLADGASSDEEDEQPAKRIKRSRSGRSTTSRSRSLSVKKETSSSPIPTPSTSHPSVRRRHSRVLASESDT